MILNIMLVVLGFFLASLAFVLVAPSFWNRAVRLTHKRIESTMPLSLAEIEADKDQLRAVFAVKIRRLEAALSRTKEKSAHQLVEISRLQMAITGLKDQIAALERDLDERRNAAAVFELTIKKRFPELEDALAAAQSALAQRAYEVADLTNKIRRREEALVTAQRHAALQQAEITRLRDAMEKSGAERSTRFKKRPSQWSLDEYRAEYDRLNVELSKLREQLSSAYDRETNQISFLKAELQQLAQHIMAAAAPASASAAAVSDARSSEKPETVSGPKPASPPRTVPLPPRPSQAERRLSRPEPWPRPKAAEPVEAEPVETPKIVRPPKAAKPDMSAGSGLENLAGKSLEEVLEAALPLAGEVLIVRETPPPSQATPAAAERKATRQSLNAPVLSEEKPKILAEHRVAEVADALAKGLAGRMEAVSNLPEGDAVKLAPEAWRVVNMDPKASGKTESGIAAGATPAEVHKPPEISPKAETSPKAKEQSAGLLKKALPTDEDAPGAATGEAASPEANGVLSAASENRATVPAAAQPAQAVPAGGSITLTEKAAMAGNEEKVAVSANGSAKDETGTAVSSEANDKPNVAGGKSGDAQAETDEELESKGKKLSLLERLRGVHEPSPS